MKNILSCLLKPLFFKYLYVFLACTFLFCFTIFSFTSCIPGFGDEDSTNNTGNTDGGDDDDDDDPPEQCESSEGEPCKDDEGCRNTCDAIYNNHAERTACKEMGSATVGKLEKVHNRLMGKKAGLDGETSRSSSQVEADLEEIADEEEDISHEDFKCYLQIDGEKWATQLTAGLGPSADADSKQKARLKETLKWMVKHETIADILKDVNDGDDILKALLLRLAIVSGNTHCMRAYDPSAPAPQKGWGIWGLGSTGKAIKIGYHDGTGTVGSIEFDTTASAELYNAISCGSSGIDGNRNVLAYSANKGNQHIFEIAFKLLTGICDDNSIQTDVSKGQDKACARAMMCFSAWKNAGEDINGATQDNINNKLWGMAQQIGESSLERPGGDTEYNQCRAENFADLFP